MLQAYKQSWLHTFHWNRRMDWNTYWQAMVIHILVGWIPVTPLVLMSEDIENPIWYLLMLPFYFSVFPVIGSTVQRLHDVGKSAWFLLLCYFLSIIGIGILILVWTIKKESSVYDNKWGEGSETREANKKEGNNFIDEELTEQSIQLERLQLFKVLAVIAGILLLLFVISIVPIFIGIMMNDISRAIMFH